MKSWGCSYRDRLSIGALLILALVLNNGSAQGEEQSVQNDSLTDGSLGMIVGDFIPGEMAAVTLTSPCDGSIVKVQIMWFSDPPGAIATLEENIWIFDIANPGGGGVNPGPVLLQLPGPVMEPGYLNQFQYMDEAGTVPIDVPVTTGQDFMVALEFGEPTDVAGGSASVLRDRDGTCRSPGNWLYGSLGGPFFWFNFCPLFGSPTGDLVIRVIVNCWEPPGACCNPDDTCDDDVQPSNCADAGQTFFQGETCAQAVCPPPTGACCISGGCLPNAEQGLCEGVGGLYAGNGTDCESGICYVGACCNLLGECSEIIELECLTSGGTFHTGTGCSPNPCQQPQGACCVNQSCFPNQLLVDCSSVTGDWAGPFTACFTDLCPLCDDGDADQDTDVDFDDFAEFQTCFQGPAGGSGVCKCLDMDNDNDVDLDDHASFRVALEASGPNAP